MPRGMSFNTMTIRYLENLPAVRKVGDGRIRYNPEFIDLFIRLRREGRGTTEIFRAAGLTPEIIGRKRIEQCAARWTEPSGREPDPDAEQRLLPYRWGREPRLDDPLGVETGRIERLERRVARLEHLLCLDTIDLSPSSGNERNRRTPGRGDA